MILPPLLAISVQETMEAITLRGEGYALVVGKERGEFDFLLRLPDGTFASPVRHGGERFWFGYNDREGEKRTDHNRPLRLALRRLEGRAEVEVECQVDKTVGSLHRAVYIALPKFVVVRSEIERGRLEGKAYIVRVAPRADVDISLLTHFALSAWGGRVVADEVHKLGRPGYVGVGPWGGPIRVESLDPEAPFLALCNPERKIGLLLLYPFYDRFWAGAHVFLQLWHGGKNYLYCGFGDERFFDKEFLFVLAPARAFDPKGLEGQARRLIEKVERAVREGEIPYPRLSALLQAEREFGGLQERLYGSARKALQRLLSGHLDPSRALPALWQANFLLSLALDRMGEEDLEGALSLLREAISTLEGRPVLSGKGR